MAENWLGVPYNIAGKRVWVAGHTGMVGAALLRQLQTENCHILTADHGVLDLRAQADVKSWMQNNKPEVVIIAAARVGGIYANATQPAEFFYDNVMIATNIIHSAYETEVERLLFLGSSCIYPREADQPIAEGALLTGALELTNEAYAIAKIAGLKMAQFYRAQYGCNFISAMPCNLYGVGDRYDAQNSHVIPALLMKAHKAKMENAPTITVWGSGTPMREFLYVDDLARALMHMLRHYNGGQHVNIGFGRDITIAELVGIVCDVVGYKGKIIFDTSKPDGTPRKIMNSNMIRAGGWQPEVSLRQGLEQSYHEFMSR